MRKENLIMLCSDANLLVHAYLDNELDAGDSVQLSRHLAGCPTCTASLERHGRLKDMLRRAAPHYRLPDAMRARVLAALPISTAAPVTLIRRPMRGWRALPAALAASVLLLVGGGLGVVWQRQATELQMLTVDVVSNHLRSLQAQHLTDVATSDQHTVKPWFDGKLDFSPQVRDLAADGFVLVGGRLDVLHGRRVAAIVYRRRLHAINLFQWPGSETDSAPTSVDAGDGFIATHWSQDGMNYWAVSNLGGGEMTAFATAFRAAPPLSVPAAR
jgi:anti-sigma factor RsiW